MMDLLAHDLTRGCHLMSQCIQRLGGGARVVQLGLVMGHMVLLCLVQDVVRLVVTRHHVLTHQHGARIGQALARKLLGDNLLVLVVGARAVVVHLDHPSCAPLLHPVHSTRDHSYFQYLCIDR